MSQIEPYNMFERVTIFVMCINLSATGAYFVRRWDVWKRMKTNNQKSVLQMYANGNILFAWLFTCMSILGILFVDFAPAMWCKYSIYTCIVFYWSTKVFIYLYLVERALIVKAGMELRNYNNVVRFEERSFQINSVLLLPYVVVLGLMLGYNIAEPTEVERCEIGLKQEAALALAVYDTIFSIIITTQFVIPLFKKSKATKRTLKTQRRCDISRHLSIDGTQQQHALKAELKRSRSLTGKLKRKVRSDSARLARKIRALAIRTLIGSAMALIVSLANMISLTLNPSQPVAQCLLLCSMDVTIGCVLVDFMSRESAAKSIQKNCCCMGSLLRLANNTSQANDTNTATTAISQNKHNSAYCSVARSTTFTATTRHNLPNVCQGSISIEIA